MANMALTLSNTTRGKLPSLPLPAMKREILGAKYELSIAFIGSTRARALNKSTRHRTYAPNVLSFPLSKSEGEIYICPMVAKRQAPSYGMNYRKFLIFLIIHGMLHLDGMDHGDRMEAMEERLLSRFA